MINSIDDYQSRIRQLGMVDYEPELAALKEELVTKACQEMGYFDQMNNTVQYTLSGIAIHYWGEFREEAYDKLLSSVYTVPSHDLVFACSICIEKEIGEVLLQNYYSVSFDLAPDDIATLESLGKIHREVETQRIERTGIICSLY
ncbi:MAG: hypothetical protein OEX12_00315 [Gammaproteobacteria bacterium]|nr:hypothetical protein [Gammaproteobacteria bacterium]